MHKEHAPTDKLILLSTDWPSSLSPAKRSTLDDDELRLLRDFSCRKAHCFKPIDRATVLHDIREQWGSEEAFDAFVQDELPAVLESSKRQYYRSWRDEVLKMLDLVLGD